MKRTKETTYKIMSAIHSKNTKPELLLGKCLWKYGLRYRKHYNIIGKPDFALVSNKVAIFCDGDFWHGNNWKLRGIRSLNMELKTYSSFWKSKITNNIKRDKRVNILLSKSGWKVFRFWESDIRINTDRLVMKVLKYIKPRKP